MTNLEPNATTFIRACAIVLPEARLKTSMRAPRRQPGHLCRTYLKTQHELHQDVSMPHMSSAEVVHHLAFGDIFVQSPDLRWLLLHNCEVESLAVMRQLCSTFMRDVPRVINSKDWQLKHRCVILYKEFSRKQCTTLYRLDPTFYRQFFLYPQEAVWIAIITGSDMARPDLLMRQLASGMASSRVYSFIWTNFEDSPDSSRLDSSWTNFEDSPDSSRLDSSFCHRPDSRGGRTLCLILF